MNNKLVPLKTTNAYEVSYTRPSNTLNSKEAHDLGIVMYTVRPSLIAFQAGPTWRELLPMASTTDRFGTSSTLKYTVLYRQRPSR